MSEEKKSDGWEERWSELVKDEIHKRNERIDLYIQLWARSEGISRNTESFVFSKLHTIFAETLEIHGIHEKFLEIALQDKDPRQIPDSVKLIRENRYRCDEVLDAFHDFLVYLLEGTIDPSTGCLK